MKISYKYSSKRAPREPVFVAHKKDHFFEWPKIQATWLKLNFWNPRVAMKTTLSLFWTLLALACGTTSGMGQTNVFHSGNPRIDEEIRQFEQQAFFYDLPPKIQWVVLQGYRRSLTLLVNGFPQSSLNEPDKLGGLDLQVWLLRSDGTAVAPIKKPRLERGSEPTSFSGGGNNEYMDSLVYYFAKIPLNELAAVVVRAQGKLYCYQIDQKKWQK